jgi:murein DD-endopeptidase MepM/ murein hydrolase activator NlpD
VGMNRLRGYIGGILGPGLEWHYYAHLDRSCTLREGDIVQAGDVLGLRRQHRERARHARLHSGIYRDAARNPYPRLIGDEARSQIAD